MLRLFTGLMCISIISGCSINENDAIIKWGENNDYDKLQNFITSNIYDKGKADLIKLAIAELAKLKSEKGRTFLEKNFLVLETKDAFEMYKGYTLSVFFSKGMYKFSIRQIRKAINAKKYFEALKAVKQLESYGLDSLLNGVKLDSWTYLKKIVYDDNFTQISSSHTKLVSPLKNLKNELQTTLKEQSSLKDDLKELNDLNIFGLVGYIVKAEGNVYEIVVNEYTDERAILKTIEAPFSSQGRFYLDVVKTGTRNVEVKNGFTQNWHVYTEVPKVLLKKRKDLKLRNHDIQNEVASLKGRISKLETSLKPSITEYDKNKTQLLNSINNILSDKPENIIMSEDEIDNTDIIEIESPSVKSTDIQVANKSPENTNSNKGANDNPSTIINKGSKPKFNIEEETSADFKQATPKPYSPFPDMKFVFISGDKFQMGSPMDEKGRKKNEKQHSVKLSSYYIMTTEVTQGMWRIVMGEKPSQYIDDSFPVGNLSWHDCQVFINELKKQHPSKDFRLPSEAEWEFACRSGSSSPTYFDESIKDLDATAWYSKNSGNKSHPVGLKEPNEFGLYDMYGNLNEWCNDWYGEYSLHSGADPIGKISGSSRVMRGGYFSSKREDCRSARRYRNVPDYGLKYCGFRLVFSQ